MFRRGFLGVLRSAAWDEEVALWGGRLKFVRSSGAVALVVRVPLHGRGCDLLDNLGDAVQPITLSVSSDQGGFEIVDVAFESVASRRVTKVPDGEGAQMCFVLRGVASEVRAPCRRAFTNGTGAEIVADGNRWRWKWRGWLSSSHDYLEVRPWTPLEIAGRLCYSARDAGEWCLVWGDHVGKHYDDVCDTWEFRGRPLYTAREGEECFLVWGAWESPRFPFGHQVRVFDEEVWLMLPEAVWRFVDVGAPGLKRLGPPSPSEVSRLFAGPDEGDSEPNPEELREDISRAASKRLRFWVAQKAGQGQRWIPVMDETEDLGGALEFARGFEAYEVAVFVVTETGSGVFYWTSLTPGLLNRTVLEQVEFSERPDPD